MNQERESDPQAQSEAMSDLGRRGFLGLMGLTAGAAAMGGGTAALADPPYQSGGKSGKGSGGGKQLKRRPNFLIIMVDEMRYAPIYESLELQKWRQKHLGNINSLRRHGMEFHNHIIMSSACQPSRTSIFTGQYPSLHGVTQTSGAAKSAIEEDMYWLDPTTVPTMGHYFRAAGYETLYKGKWHVSEDDLFQPGTYDPLPSYGPQGVPDEELEQVYLEAGILEKFGFTGWIGPEPHGGSPLNSGSSGPRGRGRDEVFARWGAREVRRLRGQDKPWLLVTSFVNPHDITLWGDLTLAARQFYLRQQLRGSTVPFDLFDSRYDTSSTESLADKPTAQGSYRDLYKKVFQPLDNNEAYHRFYYQLQTEVDKHIGKVLDAVRESDERFQRDTIILFMSDHGELLGAHGGLHQKWHCAYDEVVKVPFVVNNPALFPDARDTDILTSHADLIPTMLGLAGISQASLQRKLRSTHTQVRKLVGRDLSPLLRGELPERRFNAPQYFMTDDLISQGDQNVSWNGIEYAPITQPAHVETVIAMLPTGKNKALERWKYSRYFEDTAFWTTPGQQNVFTITEGVTTQPGNKLSKTTVTTQPAADQFEMYNVSADPTEVNNLAGNPDYASIQSRLANLLNGQRKKKRLEPRVWKRYQGPPGGVGV